MATSIEFIGIRSAYYREAMNEYPQARAEESELALHVLNPKSGECILEAGAGGGFFSLAIADRIYPGKLTATDPSLEQLESLAQFQRQNIEIAQGGADTLPASLQENCYDAIWSGGAFHHVQNKTAAFLHFHRLLKNGGRLLISDVFSGSALARHFDLEVAKYCVTGHEVSFLSEAFADSLCYLAGFQKPRFVSKTIQWKFASKEDLGIFLYKIHAMTGTTPSECYKRAEDILGVEYKNGLYCLNWPLTILSVEK